MKAIQPMIREVAFIKVGTPLRDASRQMDEYNVRHLPVLENGKVIGILSNRDILRHSSDENGILQVPKIPVEDVMTREVETCRPEDMISEIAQKMLTMKIDAIPVTDKSEQLLGFITTSDMLKIIIQSEHIQGSLKEHVTYQGIEE